jgi:chloramphenicol O-acetyltransferase type A
MNYKVIDKETYYRKGVWRHFTEDCKCSVSMTARVDVTELVKYSKEHGTKFYTDFLYILTKVLNSRDDYRMQYLWQTDELICYDRINPTQYIFHEDTETCTPVYTEYTEDYEAFVRAVSADIERAKQTREYLLDSANHPNWFDASYVSWLSYDSLNVELPDGYLYLLPIVNWGRYREEGGRLMMPVSVRLNHAAADGYLLAKVFLLLRQEILEFCREESR